MQEYPDKVPAPEVDHYHFPLNLITLNNLKSHLLHNKIYCTQNLKKST